MKTCLAILLTLPVLASAADLPAVAAPPAKAIHFYPVSEKKEKGGRFVDVPTLPKLGYIAAAPVMKVERLLSVKKVHKTMEHTEVGADGKNQVSRKKVPAIELTLTAEDAKAVTGLMQQSIGKRIYIEADGKPIYAPLVRTVQTGAKRTFSLADEEQLDAAYANLLPFVKK